MQLPPEVAAVVEEHASAFPMRELAAAAERISERYRGDRPRTGRLTATECAAWAAVRMPATWAAAQTVFEELGRRAPEARPASVLDIGAGPGGGMHACCEIFASVQRVTAMEQDLGLLALGASLASATPHPAVRQAKWLERDIRVGPPFPQHDLVLLAWVAGELDPPARAHVLQRAWDAAAFALVLIEPGTPRGFEIVRDARRQLGSAGAWLAAPCPAADDCAVPGGEWCHFAARIERTALHRRLKGGQLSYEDEKYSYLIALREPASRAVARIVRHPRHEPGLVRLDLCTGAAWRTEEIRKRQRETFRVARKARWGDEWSELSETRV